MAQDLDILLWMRTRVRKATFTAAVILILFSVGFILFAPRTKDWRYFFALTIGAVSAPLISVWRKPNPLLYLFNNTNEIQRKSLELLEYLRPYREQFPQSYYWIACLCLFLLLSLFPFAKSQEPFMIVQQIAVWWLSMILNVFLFDFVFFMFVMRALSTGAAEKDQD